jgi:dTDP-4-dehydrorhamnose 3,5-epimerase
VAEHSLSAHRAAQPQDKIIMNAPANSTEMTFTEGTIKDVIVYDLKKYFDDRGWLAELFRHDDLDEEFYPTMSYISFTKPGIQRGPHEHVDQADLFCFIGPSTFNIRLWDNRPDSPTYNSMMSLLVGVDNPKAVVVPKVSFMVIRTSARSMAWSSTARIVCIWAKGRRSRSTRSDTRTIRTRYTGWTEMIDESGVSTYIIRSAHLD